MKSTSSVIRSRRVAWFSPVPPWRRLRQGRRGERCRHRGSVWPSAPATRAP